MKIAILTTLSVVALTGGALAQSTNKTVTTFPHFVNTNAPPATLQIQPPVTTNLGLARHLVLKPPKPAQVVVGPGVVIGGAFVSLVRSPHPWQVFNPFAPARYGNGYENLSINPLTGQADGVTLLSFHLPSFHFKKAKVNIATLPTSETPP